MKRIKVRKGNIELSILKKDKQKYIENGYIVKPERDNRAVRENKGKAKNQAIMIEGYHYE